MRSSARITLEPRSFQSSSLAIEPTPTYPTITLCLSETLCYPTATATAIKKVNVAPWSMVVWESGCLRAN